jgi:hypothetical protein
VASESNDVKAVAPKMSFIPQLVGKGKRTLVFGRTLTRKRKGYPKGPSYPWAIVRDVITASPAADSSEYVAVLCEGVEELAGQWFVWRTYFTNNRYGNRCFGQFGPQAPLSVEKWINEKIEARKWYDKLQVCESHAPEARTTLP